MSALADWIREDIRRRQQRWYWQGFWEGYWEAYYQAYADARAGLPRLPLGSEFRNLCRLGLTYGNPAYKEPQPVPSSSTRSQRKAAHHGALRHHFHRLLSLLKGQDSLQDR